MLTLTEWRVRARAHARTKFCFKLHALNFVSNWEKQLLRLSRCYKKYLVMKLWVV